MGTRAAIIAKVGKTYKGIYTHWDGYPSHHGKILVEHYNNLDRLRKLFKLGYLSSFSAILEPPEGVSHSFDNPVKGVCVAYGRDRGSLEPASEGASVDEVENLISDFAFSYVYENRKWKVNGRDLKEVLSWTEEVMDDQSQWPISEV